MTLEEFRALRNGDLVAVLGAFSGSITEANDKIVTILWANGTASHVYVGPGPLTIDEVAYMRSIVKSTDLVDSV